jgi:hypothetical protein
MHADRCEEIQKETQEQLDKHSRDNQFREDEKKLLLKQVQDLNNMIQKQKQDHQQIIQQHESEKESQVSNHSSQLKEVQNNYEQMKFAMRENEEELKNMRITSQKKDAVANQSIKLLEETLEDNKTQINDLK